MLNGMLPNFSNRLGSQAKLVWNLVGSVNVRFVNCFNIIPCISLFAKISRPHYGLYGSLGKRYVDAFCFASANISNQRLQSGQRCREAGGWNPAFSTPFMLGEFSNHDIKVLGKLGYGSRSTACDLRWVRYYNQISTVLNGNVRGHKYVTLNACEQDSPSTSRELGHLDSFTTSNPSALLVRGLLDSFKATGPAGEHQCLVHEPLGMSMETLRQLIPGGKLPENLLKLFLMHLLQALDFLHKDAKMIAGIKHCTWAFGLRSYHSPLESC